MFCCKGTLFPAGALIAVPSDCALVQAFQQTSDLGAALRVRQAAHPIGITDCRAAAAGGSIALGVFAGDGLVLLGAHPPGVIGQIRVLGLPQRRHIVCRVLTVQTGVAAEIPVGRQGLGRVQVPGVAVVVLIQQRLCPLVCAVSGQGRPAGPSRSFSVGKWAQKCPLMRISPTSRGISLRFVSCLITYFPGHFNRNK